MASRPAKKNVPLSKASRNTRKGVESGSIIDYSALTYDSFRVLATASGLSRHERVGFPDSYRVGKEALIYRDIVSKIPCVKSKNLVRVLDIGPGCSNLPLKLLKSVTDRGGGSSTSSIVLKCWNTCPRQITFGSGSDGFQIYQN